MTIDEAIKNHKCEAKKCREEIIKAEYLEPQEKYYNSQCVRLAEEHKQLAEWLEELKALNQTTQMVDKSNFSQEQYKADTDTAYQCGYTKAIDDFAEKVKEIYPFTILELEELDKVAEQLKEGGVE